MTAVLQPGYIWCRKCGAPVRVGKKCPLCRTESVPLPKSRPRGAADEVEDAALRFLEVRDRHPVRKLDSRVSDAIEDLRIALAARGGGAELQEERDE